MDAARVGAANDDARAVVYIIVRAVVDGRRVCAARVLGRAHAVVRIGRWVVVVARRVRAAGN